MFYYILIAARKDAANKAYISTRVSEYGYTDTESAKNLMARSGPAEFKKEIADKGWGKFTFKMKEYHEEDIAQRALHKFQSEYEVLNARLFNFPAYRRTARPSEENGTASEPQEPANATASEPQNGHTPRRRQRVLPAHAEFNLEIVEAALTGRVIDFNGTKYRVRLEPV